MVCWILLLAFTLSVVSLTSCGLGGQTSDNDPSDLPPLESLIKLPSATRIPGRSATSNGQVEEVLFRVMLSADEVLPLIRADLKNVGFTETPDMIVGSSNMNGVSHATSFVRDSDFLVVIVTVGTIEFSFLSLRLIHDWQ